MKNIVVTDQPEYWQSFLPEISVISSIDYLLNQDYKKNQTVRVINLSSSYRYQSLGYYVSLIASARRHKVMPSVLTLQDVRNPAISRTLFDSLSEEIQAALRHEDKTHYNLTIFFGKNINPEFNTLSKHLYGILPMPLFRVYFEKKKEWIVEKIKIPSFKEMPKYQHDFLLSTITDFFQKKRFYIAKQQQYLHDLAILINPDEKTPPSNQKAIKRFILAGERLGFNVDLIEKSDYKLINNYDALFIRETTAVNHHTYLFSRRAFTEQLVVLDDPNSILQCANKVYLAELLKKSRLATPDTKLLSRINYDKEKETLFFPCVIKLPDSAFSKGVIKIDSLKECDEKIKPFFKVSDLVIAQAFLPSDYDWRIGILDGKPLFACRYYMAKNHWQIYNWKAKSKDNQSGRAETLAIEETPKIILDTAIRAANLIGDGLYGVDLKEINQKAYVIEINDNPNIDHKIEDEVLGDELYNQIMRYFLVKIQKGHGYYA